jgi:hypothetical protein
VLVVFWSNEAMRIILFVAELSGTAPSPSRYMERPLRELDMERPLHEGWLWAAGRAVAAVGEKRAINQRARALPL